MQEIISEKEIQDRINAYLEMHAEELNEKIDKKISTTVTQAINAAFDHYSSRPENWGFAYKLVFESVQGQLTEYIESGNAVQIDVNKIQEQVNKQVRSMLKKIDIKIG
ncbi:hypothetical protein [Lacticaseibacillus saniviri]